MSQAKFNVRRVAVLGAGVMGAQIAAHLVNASVPTVLFDLASPTGDKSAIAKKPLLACKSSNLPRWRHGVGRTTSPPPITKNTSTCCKTATWSLKPLPSASTGKPTSTAWLPPTWVRHTCLPPIPQVSASTPLPRPAQTACLQVASNKFFYFVLATQSPIFPHFPNGINKKKTLLFL